MVALVAVVAAIAATATSVLGARSRSGSGHPAVRPAVLGVNLGGAANAAFPGIAPGTQVAVVSSIARSGARWLRIDVPFGTEEPSPGRYDWTVSSEVRVAGAAGLKVLAVIDYPPAWARSADGTPLPAPYGGFAAATAAALGPLGVGAYEIGNEPNLATYWGAAVSGAGYAAVLAASDRAIHAADPLATVVAGGLAQTATSGSVALAPLEFLRAMYSAGAHGTFDALADHPYTFPDQPDPAATGNAFSTLGGLRRIMDDHGDSGRQIWLTEYGAPTAGPGMVSQADQAAMIRTAAAFAAGTSWVGPLFVFDWRDDGADGAFGLLTGSGSPKPAYEAFAAAAAGGRGRA